MGKRCSQKDRAATQVAGVQPHVGAAGLVHPPGDRLGDDVAWREVGELVLTLHEPVAVEVDEERTLAADRLADQWLLAARVRAEVHHRRVELHELEVAQHRTRTQRQCHPVTGRHGRVGGLREDLPEPSRGEYDGPAAHRADTVALALSHHVQGDPGDPAVVREQRVHGQGVLDHLDVRGRVDGRHQRSLDLRAGGVTAGVRDPVPVMSTFAGQREHALRGVVEVGTQRDQLAYGLGTLVHQDPHRLGVAGSRAGHEGVPLVLVRGVPGPERGGDPALRPLRRPGRQHVLRDDEDLLDLVPQPQRGGEAGDAGADHHDIGTGGPSRPAGSQAAGQQALE